MSLCKLTGAILCGSWHKCWVYPNLPEFAQIAPHSFWVAADAHELADGRTCTDLQLALSGEQSSGERNGLARELMRIDSRKRLRFIILRQRTTSASHTCI